MSARGFKLRFVFAWMAGVSVIAFLLMGIVWKQYAYVNLSRDLMKSEKEIGSLQNQVMVYETEIRGLKQPARLEALARDHFGLVDGGVPVLVQAEGQVLASGGESGVSSPGNANDTMKTASWRERLFR